jgi:hypothetical protein
MVVKPRIIAPVLPSISLEVEDITAMEMAIKVDTISPEMVPNTKMFLFIVFCFFRREAEKYPASRAVNMGSKVLSHPAEFFILSGDFESNFAFHPKV